MNDPRYNRTFADRLNEWTGQPVFWAAIASLGLHGILFAALPSFSSGTVNLDERTVSVVELGAEELQRLPNFPELDTPALPDVEDPYDFALDPLENWDDILKDLGIEDTPEPVVPRSPGLLAPLPRSPLLPPPISTPRPLPGPIFDWSTTSPSRINIPSISTPPTTPPATPPPPKLEAANPPNIENQINDSPTNDNGENIDSGQDTPVEPSLTPEQRQERLVARLLADNQQQQQSISAYLDGATQVNDLLNKWIGENPDNREAIIPENVPLPLEACAVGQEARAVLYVAVGQNNKVLENNDDLPNPIFVQLSAYEYITKGGKYEGQYFDAVAYGILDETALDIVQQHNYSNEPSAGQNRWYPFVVDFTFDAEACREHLAKQAATENNQPPPNEPNGTSSENTPSVPDNNELPSPDNSVPDPNAQDVGTTDSPAVGSSELESIESEDLPIDLNESDSLFTDDGSPNVTSEPSIDTDNSPSTDGDQIEPMPDT